MSPRIILISDNYKEIGPARKKRRSRPGAAMFSSSVRILAVSENCFCFLCSFFSNSFSCGLIRNASAAPSDRLYGKIQAVVRQSWPSRRHCPFKMLTVSVIYVWVDTWGEKCNCKIVKTNCVAGTCVPHPRGPVAARSAEPLNNLEIQQRQLLAKVV